MIRIRNKNGRREVVTSSFSSQGGLSQGTAGYGSLLSTSCLLGGSLKDDLLTGIIDDSTPQKVAHLLRDIYYHDIVCGATVDLKSTLPWSDFELYGASDEQLTPFYDTLERLNYKQLHESVSVDQQVMGSFVGSLVFNKSERKFVDIIPFDFADCEVRTTPLYSEEPIITLNINPELKKFAMDKGEQLDRIQKKIPQDILNHFRNSKKVELDPLTTIYLPNCGLTKSEVGVSALRRVIPIYLLERVIYRGTLSEATRRQRSTLHVTAGSEDWIPQEVELNALVGLFQCTEQDPISSVVATRNDVQTQEIRAGGDFWKWTDIIDQLNDLKMKAMGVNDAFLTGDSTYANMETALSVFMEDLSSFRDRVTTQLYYSKLFPLISELNGFREEKASLQDIHTKLNDTRNLLIPRIRWNKKLKPDFDRDYMEILDQMTERGVPVTLRMWAAAGGLDIDSLIKEIDDDNSIKEQIKEKRQESGSGGEDEDEYGDEFSSLSPGARFLKRPYKGQEIANVRQDGTKHWQINQHKAHKKINGRINDILNKR